MIFNAEYSGRSAIQNGTEQGQVKFATNLLREATFFRGTLAQPVLFREALAALHSVVVSDFKYRPKDRFEFQEWLKKQDEEFLASLGIKNEKIREQLEVLEARKVELDALRLERLKPFHRARRNYFDYAYHHDYELEMLLDPVITVHPDELSFEAFSKDESTYGRLAARYELYDHIDEFECGTTNIDFSLKLHRELERMRSYRQTEFTVDPGGFTVTTEASESHKEKKIDLPESWVNGFLQVHAVMSMNMTHLTLAPIDLFNLCRFLRRFKTKQSPRSLRWELEPGQQPKIVIEPWDHELTLTGAEPFDGPKAMSIRTWGRDRLRTLSRLVPLCRKVDVYLAGYGLPSCFLVDLGPILFTLGLSGWTDNDWTGGTTSFDMLTRRLEVSAEDVLTVDAMLKDVKFASDQDVALKTKLGLEKGRSALSHLCQAGRAMIDLGSGFYRHRDLFQTPFTIKEATKVLHQAGEENNPIAKAARNIYEIGNARLTSRRPVVTGWKLSGSVKGSDQKRVRPQLHIDDDGKIIEATCTCSQFKSDKLTKGPCEHMLALRLVHMDRLEEEDTP